jgi:hypothetical protein
MQAVLEWKLHTPAFLSQRCRSGERSEQLPYRLL